jgi:hypothetical protein
MSSKRKILIISAPDYNKELIDNHTIISDGGTHRNYFLTGEGGNWNQDTEMIWLNDKHATIENISTEVSKLDCHFTISIFIGHGRSDSSTGEQILGDYFQRSFLLDTLKNNSPKQLIIIDTCSIDHSSPPQEFDRQSIHMDYPTPINQEIEIANTSDLYIANMEKARKGVTIISAADIGQKAYSEASFGLFSGAIHYIVRRWLKESEAGDILSVSQMFKTVKNYFELHHSGIQTPRISNQECDFPWAVNPGYKF